ncbi:DUF6517 family protein [Halopiger xanaduensis]|uniref:Lipoprotein n=1 Tax=Halopiger xanaduensis (strain DSM 18323 / JCM 14033 / SH-6) TaxID=797210 RepID=F8D5K0_HALXS|nr:DUF6517 family protein [Halopiger xanaduensis]AEH38836.1 hypothetical protein Halxa_4234 [Halopiger xanaduensis SH-6]
MTPSRRSLLAAGTTSALALTAGCLDFVLGNGPLEFDAERVAPTDAAFEETGYEETQVEEQSIDETIQAGVERDVRASMWLSLYSKARDLQGETIDASVFAAVSIPAIEVAGRSFNPIENMSNEELLEEVMNRAGDDFGSVRNIGREESFGLDILGAGREVDVFSGETEFEGRTVEVEISLTSFAHEEDLLILVGSHPKPFAEESANLEVLMESVEHPV